MALPVKPLPESSVEVNGSSVSFRSLSRAEALEIQKYVGREDEAEVFILVRACGVTEAEAKEFRDSTPALEAGKLLDAILIFSDLATADQIAASMADPKRPTNGASSQASLTLTSS